MNLTQDQYSDITAMIALAWYSNLYPIQEPITPESIRNQQKLAQLHYIHDRAFHNKVNTLAQAIAGVVCKEAVA